MRVTFGDYGEQNEKLLTIFLAIFQVLALFHNYNNIRPSIT